MVTAVTVSAITPTVLNSGATITITGKGLDRVSSVTIGGVSVTPSQISATQITLIAPTSPNSKTVQLVLTDSSVVTLSQTVRVDPVITVSNWSPKSGLSTIATNVTITGSGLSASNGVTSVRYGAGSVATIVSQNNGQLVFTIPAGASTGPVTLQSNLSGFQYTVGTFTVTPGVSVTGMSPSAGPASTLVRISGGALNTVSAVTVGGMTATISAQTASTLDFLAPAQSGAVMLSAPGGQSVNAGSFTYQPASGGGAGGSATVSVPQVDLAQTYSQAISKTSSVAIVNGKPALVRAYVVGSSAITSPTITATLAGCAASPTLTLTGPATLPTTQPAAANLAATFNGTIPATCVNSALAVTVNVAASASNSAVSSATMTPNMSRVDKPMNVVLVPLVTNGTTATIPTANDIASLKNMLDAVYPLQAPATVSVRAPYTMAATSVVSTSQWSTALDELQKLWAAEVPDGGVQYYGLVPDPTGKNALLGLGYENAVGDTGSNAWMVAIGEDISKDPEWTNTFAHEVGHNHSLPHAPCGSAGSADPNYPTSAGYANAGLGLSAIYDRTVTPAIALQPALVPTSNSYDHDIMSYCNSRWFSDYNYANIQKFHAKFGYARIATLASPIEMLDFSGEISANGVILRPTSARMSTQPYQGGGDWTLRLFLANGTEVTQTFAPKKVADGADGVSHFSVSVAKTADVTRIQVEHAGQVHPLIADPALKDAAAMASGSPAAAQKAGLDTPTSNQPIRWRERSGKLLVHWDATANPSLSVRHVGAAVTALGIRMQGGYAEIDTSAVPAGGEWEFSLSNGLSAKVHKAPRQ